MRRVMVLAALTAIAACAPKPEAPATVARGGCDAAAVQDLIGKQAGAVEAEALRRSGARSVRRYRTGDMLTMDFRADRLNVETDAGGTIVALRCG